jgi:hypothetical protein
MEPARSYRSTNFGLPTKPGRVGSCISLFEACSAFTRVTACTLAKSPSDSLHQRLQQFRCLHYCSDCYRVERTSSRAGLTPAVDHHLFTAHPVMRTYQDLAAWPEDKFGGSDDSRLGSNMIHLFSCDWGRPESVLPDTAAFPAELRVKDGAGP